VQPSSHDRHDWGNQQQDFDAINAQGHGCGEHSRCCRDAGTHPVEFAVAGLMLGLIMFPAIASLMDWVRHVTGW
jgi:hypothetical protein